MHFARRVGGGGGGERERVYEIQDGDMDTGDSRDRRTVAFTIKVGLNVLGKV